ncbi:hypothetical protein [Plantactinospora sp. KBS50]|uniref:hypothetical protein n=1 Tax=Plantactinospora sp. KBS50 TaxID=2024580 RepID=UPI0012FD994E|nr:hypothetical protein [Plantactinospora sp. KBS50]
MAVTIRLWRHLDRMVLADNDQILFEWMLARAAQAVRHLENPLYSAHLNAPDGVNLMANTSILGLGIPLAPVTLLFGSTVTLRLVIVLCLAGTSAAWYLLLSRRLVASRSAAAVAGLFCGFAPGMISQATCHLHMISQFLVPAIIAVALPPTDGRTVRRGVLLGLLVAYQVFLGEEVLVFLVLALGVFCLSYLAARPRAVRRAGPLLRRLAVAVPTAGVLLAYPVWFQFAGPGSYRGMPFSPSGFYLDLASYTTMARQSITGSDAVPGLLSPNLSEESSFFGLSLIVLVAVVVLWQWRRPLVRALAVTAVCFAALSLGNEIWIKRQDTGIPGPYRLVSRLPLLDLVVPARFPLICIPIVAILLAISLDRAYRLPGRPVRLLWTGAVAAVLLPLVPTPLRSKPAWPVPEFVASGQWRSYVPAGRTLVAVPPTKGGEATNGMYWSARTGLAFTTPGGYFIGPTGPHDRQARWGAPDRPTAVLLDRVAFTGQVPAVGAPQRAQAAEDLRHWRAAVVVQGGLTRGEPVKETLDLLLGPGRFISGAWVWDVRPLTS